MLLKILSQIRRKANPSSKENEPAPATAKPEDGVQLIAAAAHAQGAGAYREAIGLWQRALAALREQSPEQSAAILVNMGAAHAALVDLEQAERCYERAIQLSPTLAEAHYNLGCLVNDMGRVEEAEGHVRRALELRPDFHQAGSTLLCIHVLRRGTDKQTLLEEHRRWAAAHASGFAPLVRREQVDADPGRRLTIGYVSADLREHSVSYFIEPVLAGHDRAAFRVICYDNWGGEDAVNLRLRGHADEWRRIARLDDDAAAQLILQDKVDILVDLSGHTVGNRLLVFARRPAPIQVSWFGYMSTTGMDAMDYRITDAYLDPPGQTERYYSEQLVRLRAAAGFSPSPDAPAVNAPPCLDPSSKTVGHVTFGSFNNYAKVGDEVLAAWVRILNALPTSRLLLVALGGDSAEVRRGIAARFARLGLADTSQLDVRGRRPMAGFFAALQEADIALDPFPYSGGTTSLHTLWMGVPIVTLEGDSELSKATSGVLRGAGADALVATSVQQYCDIVLALAANPEQMRTWRARLRDMVRVSPGFSADEVTGDLERAFRGMWHTWTENAAPRPRAGA